MALYLIKDNNQKTDVEVMYSSTSIQNIEIVKRDSKTIIYVNDSTLENAINIYNLLLDKTIELNANSILFPLFPLKSNDIDLYQSYSYALKAIKNHSSINDLDIYLLLPESFKIHSKDVLDSIDNYNHIEYRIDIIDNLFISSE